VRRVRGQDAVRPRAVDVRRVRDGAVRQAVRPDRAVARALARRSRCTGRGGAGSVRGVIDLRSDTLTKPTPEMLAPMTAAEGGDQYVEDPTVNALQERMATLLGHEAALFLPTATMANQVALRTQTRPGSMLLAQERTHVMVYEMGGPAIHSGLVMQTVLSDNG